MPDRVGDLIIGGGPAGLTAAYMLAESQRPPVVLEMSDHVGGIARTEEHNGYRFDIGGHRFFTKVKQVQDLWKHVMGDDFISVPRSSRIYYQHRFYDYPLQLFNALMNLGSYESMRIMLSYFKWKVMPSPEEENFEQWVSNRFGGRLYWHFFRTYTEKVWGIPCTEIRADWAAQRIKNLSLKKAVWNAVSGQNDTTSLIKTFDYPRLGPGMMWEKFAAEVTRMGGEVRMQTRADRIHHDGKGHVTAVDITPLDGEPHTVEPEQVINTMPLATLMRCLDPAPPAEVLEAASLLKYRDFLIVGLICEVEEPFEDNWIYIHSPHVKVGRVQNFKRWSAEMVPDPRMTSLGMEYFCHKGDGLWNMADTDLIELAKQEVQELDLVSADTVRDGVVIRQEKAYPVYDENYRAAVDVISAYVNMFDNLQTVGRNGMHRYNNMDHSMLTAMLAARNILGEDHDVWDVNVERSYHEDFTTRKGRNDELAEQDEQDVAAKDPLPSGPSSLGSVTSRAVRGAA